MSHASAAIPPVHDIPMRGVGSITTGVTVPLVGRRRVSEPISPSGLHRFTHVGTSRPSDSVAGCADAFDAMTCSTTTCAMSTTNDDHAVLIAMV